MLNLQTLHMSVFTTASILNLKMLHFGRKIFCLSRDMSNIAQVRWIYALMNLHVVMGLCHMYRCNNLLGRYEKASGADHSKY